jgi:hypothetical protein
MILAGFLFASTTKRKSMLHQRGDTVFWGQRDGNKGNKSKRNVFSTLRGGTYIRNKKRKKATERRKRVE